MLQPNCRGCCRKVEDDLRTSASNATQYLPQVKIFQSRGEDTCAGLNVVHQLKCMTVLRIFIENTVMTRKSSSITERHNGALK